MSSETTMTPEGQLSIRQIPSFGDANRHGDISGGWVVSLMDEAAEHFASQRAQGRVANVSMENSVFTSPIRVGNTVSVYTKLLEVGSSSVRIGIEVWTQSPDKPDARKVVDTSFVYVAIDDAGRIRQVPQTV